MKRKFTLLVTVCLIGLLITGAAYAQQEGQSLRLGIVRNFGYGGFGKIQGNFTLKIVDPPADLVEVSFYMGDELMSTIEEEPFRIRFHTSEYPDGEHQMFASGVLVDGSEVVSNTITTTFLSSEQAWGETQQIIFPLLIGIGVITLLGIGAPLLIGRKKEFTLGKYGPAGGAVCPRCELPFSRPFLAPNMVVGKLVRCPHCGKISILPRASAASLQTAESRYLGEGKTQVAVDGKDDFEQMIEDSRFED